MQVTFTIPDGYIDRLQATYTNIPALKAVMVSLLREDMIERELRKARDSIVIAALPEDFID